VLKKKGGGGAYDWVWRVMVAKLGEGGEASGSDDTAGLPAAAGEASMDHRQAGGGKSLCGWRIRFEQEDGGGDGHASG
jgi:hypothetical protein